MFIWTDHLHPHHSMYSSKQRAEAFLFILHRLLETPSVAQDWDTPGRIGDFVLQATDTSHENQDTEEEIAWGQSHQEKRAVSLHFFHSPDADKGIFSGICSTAESWSTSIRTCSRYALSLRFRALYR